MLHFRPNRPVAATHDLIPEDEIIRNYFERLRMKKA
jgi:hypothetical protein